ncbi:rab9 effector protein with kelch motifs [Hypomesus transpacificus]|uniref:rab9 effector protein with kelch motifs n=1 Tax=Hypomesus transpacificus TaxID=137520 RepID=UPI001F07E55C|nr:rab9 effector protein with kelch motifs [Hypomesus transpacificus]
MALASGHWVDKEVRGEAPSPRHGHALALAGNIAFLFGGVSCRTLKEDETIYLNDFYMITGMFIDIPVGYCYFHESHKKQESFMFGTDVFVVSPTHVLWELMPQNGTVPSARQGHTLCVVKGKLYLFGGVSSSLAEECLQGVYCFDIISLTWECLTTKGMSLRATHNSSAAVGDGVYVFGGLLHGVPSDDLMLFNTVSLSWTPVKTTGNLPSARYNHTLAVVSEQVFMFGGCAEDGCYYKDVHVLNTESLVWQKWDVKGESPVICGGQTLVAHHDKDIYLFGGKVPSQDGPHTSTNEILKLSIGKMKWKVPLYVGIPPARRHDVYIWGQK